MVPWLGMGKRATYTVRIHYREPTRKRKTPNRKRPYHLTYRITASSGEEAKRRAIDEFRHVQKLPKAGWPQEILFIEFDGQARRATA